MTRGQYVDPQVSRTKFDREIAEYRQVECDYLRRGWFLVRADFPSVLVVLAAPQLTPPAIVTGVAFDYTNYDMEPPSVRLVDPFTGEPYKAKELPTHLKRSVETNGPPIPGLQLPLGAQARFKTQLPLMQWYGPDDTPFLCLAGVREYHQHPGHSGDAWELHRRSGAGRLVRLLETITKYGIEPISDYQIKLQPLIAGFIQHEVPS
ncbi:MAG TPA: putative metal-binding protein [Blastocatellia bacterium]|nr:putative metal-binding protein [Blastocatellia bacterium]